MNWCLYNFPYYVNWISGMDGWIDIFVYDYYSKPMNRFCTLKVLFFQQHRYEVTQRLTCSKDIRGSGIKGSPVPCASNWSNYGYGEGQASVKPRTGYQLWKCEDQENYPATDTERGDWENRWWTELRYGEIRQPCDSQSHLLPVRLTASCLYHPPAALTSVSNSS